MYWNLFWFLSFLWYLIKINFDLGILYFVNKKNSFWSKMIYKWRKNVVLFMLYLKFELYILLYCKISYMYV